MLALTLSAPASNQGKTLLATALLWHFRDSVRPFKIGPDFIDPQFHERVCGVPSVNLDSWILTPEQVRWMYAQYADRDVAILEGVMGYYDGEDRGCSAYSVSRLLEVPTVMVLDGSGSYITLSAVLKGLREYREGSTIRAVVLNRLASASHYALIRRQIERDHPDIRVAGWIRKDLPTLKSTHLGLDLKDLGQIETIAQEVLEHIDLEMLKSLETPRPTFEGDYPFPPVPRIAQTLGVVHDRNFSFLYHDNLRFLDEVFDRVVTIDATADEPIPPECDALYLPGGYVETEEAYGRIVGSERFRKSLIAHAASHPVYAECAGLLYLGERVDDRVMSGVLPIAFTLQERFCRLGYYTDEAGVRGHAFHYTCPTPQTLARGYNVLRKRPGGAGEPGSWKQGRVVGTYLHTMFRGYPEIVFLMKNE